jgi:hypothetical protein
MKINFDHHKGTFECLAMLKTIADEFYFVSRDTFKKLKIFFFYTLQVIVQACHQIYTYTSKVENLHCIGTKLHLWSIKYCEEELFELWREDFLKINPLFEDRLEFLPLGVQFFWNLRVNVVIKT